MLGGSLLLGVAICEIGLRVLGVAYPDWFVDDPIFGRALRPGASGWWTKEGRGFVHITPDGRRDRERSLVKPADAFRIAVLGDSFAAAFEVSQQDTFWSVLEDELEGCPALGERKPEVINFGVGGYGTASQWLVLQHKVWPYDPDLVLLAFLTGNDLSDNVRELKGSSKSAYFVLRDGELMVDEEFARKREKIERQSRIYDWWIEHSRVFQVFSRARRALKHRFEQPVPQSGEPDTLCKGSESAIFMPPECEVWQRAWAVTEALLVAIRDEVREHGARFVLVDLTNGIQVDPDFAARQRFADTIGQEDLIYPDRRLAAFAAREQMHSIMLVPPLLEWAEANQICVHGFPNLVPCRDHWNEHGHRLAGETIAARLCDELLADVPPSVGPGTRRR